MGQPVKTKGMLNFERQLNEAFTMRTLPDGWIGDANHRGEVSSHNPDDTPGSKPEWDGDSDKLPEVRAVDVWKNLGPGINMQDLVNHLVKLPKLSTVIRYMIYAGFIYRAANDFRAVEYTGSNPHYDHLHVTFAFSDNADENTTYDFRMDDVNMPSVDEIWGKDVDPTGGSYTASGALFDANRRTDSLANDQVPALAKKVDALTEIVNKIAAAVLPPK